MCMCVLDELACFLVCCNGTAATEIYTYCHTLSLHDALPICGPPPRVRVMEKGRKGALGVGDRILARTEERGNGHVAYPMKRLQAGGEMVVGVLVTDTGPGGKPVTWLRPADKRARFDFAVSDLGDAAIGDLDRKEHTSELQSLMR